MTTEEFKLEVQAIRPRLISQAQRYLDNTDDAEDSRTFGRIEEGEIYGKVITIIRTRRP